MSLRLRAVLIAGIALALLWALAAAWMLRDVHGRLNDSLDQRLAMSARMVAGLLHRSTLLPSDADELLSSPVTVGGGERLACQIRTQRGEIVAATSGTPAAAFDAPVPGFANRVVNGETWRIYTHQADGYFITTADRLDQRDGLVRDILLAATVPFLVALLGGLLALWIGISRGLAPMDALRRTLQSRSADSTDPIDDARAPAELRPPLAALNGLLARLADTLRQQRAFTDAAAHELRTPLTVIDTHLQVAELSPDDAVGRDSLHSAREGVRRLRHTLDQLMSLARAEAPVATDDPCDSVLAAVDDVLERLEPRDRQRVALRVSGTDTSAAIPHSMLMTALRNILDNALLYSGEDGAIVVDVDFAPEPHAGICIQVSDSGPGMDEHERSKAMQRFWRSGRGQAGRGGAGLGLSIVEAILARHGGSVRLEPAGSGGLSVSLDLPPDRISRP